MTAPVIRNYGDRALLLECGSIDDVLALAAELRAAELPGVADIVPGARTVLVSLTDSEWLTQVRARLSSIAVGKPAGPPSGQTDAVIDVAYGGSDLDEVCALLDMEPRAVIEAHTATAWRVGFVGFAPGFAYLLGGTLGCTCPDEPNRGSGFRPDRWRWPADTAASTHESRLAGGS